MISEDVIAPIQLNPLEIELCRTSNMKGSGDDRGGRGPRFSCRRCETALVRIGLSASASICGTSYSPADRNRSTAARRRAGTVS